MGFFDNFFKKKSSGEEMCIRDSWYSESDSGITKRIISGSTSMRSGFRTYDP